MGSDSIPQEAEGIFPLEFTWVLTPFLKRQRGFFPWCEHGFSLHSSRGRGDFSLGVDMGSDSIPKEAEGIFPLELTWVPTPFLKRQRGFSPWS